MILVDSSIWIQHFRRPNGELIQHLEKNHVLVHSFVIGELACGSLRKRSEVLGLLSALPFAAEAKHDEVLHLIEAKNLFSRGLGWVDMHLLAAALLHGVSLWTLDKRLAETARLLGVGH